MRQLPRLSKRLFSISNRLFTIIRHRNWLRIINLGSSQPSSKSSITPRSIPQQKAQSWTAHSTSSWPRKTSIPLSAGWATQSLVWPWVNSTNLVFLQPFVSLLTTTDSLRKIFNKKSSAMTKMIFRFKWNCLVKLLCPIRIKKRWSGDNCSVLIPPKQRLPTRQQHKYRPRNSLCSSFLPRSEASTNGVKRIS